MPHQLMLCMQTVGGSEEKVSVREAQGKHVPFAFVVPPHPFACISAVVFHVGGCAIR